MRTPARRSASASVRTVVVLPVPPFWERTAIVCAMARYYPGHGGGAEPAGPRGGQLRRPEATWVPPGTWRHRRPGRAGARGEGVSAQEARRSTRPRTSSTTRSSTGTAEHGEEEWSIRCYDVHKRLGGVAVLDGLNVAIPDNTITTVLGPSGTGKSVLIKHLIGLMFPDSGDVVVKGQSVPSLPMQELLALRRRIGVLFQDGALFGSMSLYDNVAFPLRQHTDMSEAQICRAGARARQRRGARRRRSTTSPTSSPGACASARGSRGRW